MRRSCLQSGGRRAEVEELDLSIIVPVLNEVAVIRPFLHHIRRRAPGAEIIVVDGGSSDGTASRASGACDGLLVSPRPGRGIQMNLGASHASGAVLWFLHVDSLVPGDCLERIATVLDDPRVAGGFFRVRLPRHEMVFRLTDELSHWLGLLLRVRYGDHGFFCRREAFDAAGGFPDVALMEDVDFHRALRRLGRVRAIPRRLTISPRRYDSVGPYRLTAAWGVISALYVMHAPRSWQHRLYGKMCNKAAGTRHD